jgi:hypothetical protein
MSCFTKNPFYTPRGLLRADLLEKLEKEGCIEKYGEERVDREIENVINEYNIGCGIGGKIIHEGIDIISFLHRKGKRIVEIMKKITELPAVYLQDITYDENKHEEMSDKVRERLDKGV